MFVSRSTLAAAALLMLGTASGASAQTFSITALGGYERLAASKSAKAVFDGSGGSLYGGELTFDLGTNLYAGAGIRTFAKTGERAFVADANSEPFRLGLPLRLRVTPVYGLVGYRFGGERASLRGYVSGGAGIALYRESSEIAGVEERDELNKFCALGMLGAEYGSGILRFGVEGAYIAVPDAMGAGGVSAVYGEKNAGGFAVTARVRLLLGR